MVFTISPSGITFSLQNQLLNTFVPRAGRDRLEDLQNVRDKGIEGAIKDRQEKQDKVKDLLDKADKIDKLLSFEKGGTITRTGDVKLHRDEMVVRAKDAPKVKAAMEKHGIPVPKGNGEGRPIIGYTKPNPEYLAPIPVYGSKPKPRPPSIMPITPKPEKPIYQLPKDWKIGDKMPKKSTPASRKKK